MRAGAALVLLAAAVLASCTRHSSDPVQAMLDDLVAAAESRDASAFGERLSESFRGSSGQPKPVAVGEVRRWLAAYESVQVQIYPPEVERRSDGATVRVVAAFKGQARRIGPLAAMLPPSAVYRFTMEAADEGGTWRVRTATWEPIQAEEPR